MPLARYIGRGIYLTRAVYRAGYNAIQAIVMHFKVTTKASILTWDFNTDFLVYLLSTSQRIARPIVFFVPLSVGTQNTSICKRTLCLTHRLIFLPHVLKQHYLPLTLKWLPPRGRHSEGGGIGRIKHSVSYLGSAIF
jgi:hypothetical protein